jgi:hypothetical protein
MFFELGIYNFTIILYLIFNIFRKKIKIKIKIKIKGILGRLLLKDYENPRSHVCDSRGSTNHKLGIRHVKWYLKKIQFASFTVKETTRNHPRASKGSSLCLSSCKFLCVAVKLIISFWLIYSSILHSVLHCIWKVFLKNFEFFLN